MSSPGEPTKEYAEHYDTIIRRVFPCYDAILALLATSIPDSAPNVLVCGCGTGNEINAICHLNKIGQVHGFDKSQIMLAEAKNKTKHLDNVFLHLTHNFEISEKGPFAVVISTLISHLLGSTEEKTLYLKKIREYTMNGGIVIFTDIFLTGDKKADEQLYEMWENHLKKINDATRISKDFAILRKASFPSSHQEFSSLAAMVGFSNCIQIFQYFTVRTFILT